MEVKISYSLQWVKLIPGATGQLRWPGSRWVTLPGQLATTTVTTISLIEKLTELSDRFKWLRHLSGSNCCAANRIVWLKFVFSFLAALKYSETLTVKLICRSPQLPRPEALAPGLIWVNGVPMGRLFHAVFLVPICYWFQVVHWQSNIETPLWITQGNLLAGRNNPNIKLSISFSDWMTWKVSSLDQVLFSKQLGISRSKFII